MLVTSAGTLVLEIVAARLLAPTVGVSLYTWTSVIGVVPGGRSLGLHGWLRASGPVPLTDDHASVDRPAAPVFLERGFRPPREPAPSRAGRPRGARRRLSHA